MWRFQHAGDSMEGQTYGLLPVHCPRPSWRRTTEHHPTAEGRHRGRAPLSSYCGCLPSRMGLTNWTRWRGRTSRKSAWSGTDEWKLNSWKPACTMLTSSKDTPSNKVGNVVKRDFLSFRLDLAHKLVEGYYVEKAPVGRPRTEANDNDPRLDRMDHWPVRGEGKDHLCEVCNARHKHHERRNPGVSYRDNPFKQRKTTMKCEKCSVYLCCNQHDCFKVYQTRVTFVWHVDIEAEDTNAQRLTCIIVYRSRFSFLCF